MPGADPAVPGTGSPVVMGRVSGVYGIKGWVKVVSHTRPPENLLGFDPWLVRAGAGWQTHRVIEQGRSGGALTVRLDGMVSRTEAQQLVGRDIAVNRDQLPPLPQGRYYWSDLVGLRVVSGAGRDFGRVAGLVETGANDVMEVTGPAGRFLIPFVAGRVVEDVDMAAGVIRVDWDPEYR